MTRILHCTIAKIVDANDLDQVLATVAVANQNESEKLLDLVVEAAVRFEGWTHAHAASLMRVEVGDSVVATPAPLIPALGQIVWAECRGAFVEEPTDDAVVDLTERRMRAELRRRGVEPDPHFPSKQGA